MTTTTIQPCDHGALYPLEPCGPCQRAGAPPERPTARTEVGPDFIAEHTTTCPTCGFDVTTGQQARMVSRKGRPARAHHAGTCVKEAARG